MSDIVERLRNWRIVHLARLHLLMDEAADEIERLRLTDDEREAVLEGMAIIANAGWNNDGLRCLLERLG
jgi:hypothetical protein